MRTLLVRAREELNLQPPGPQPGVLSVELRALVSRIIVIDWSFRSNLGREPFERKVLREPVTCFFHKRWFNNLSVRKVWQQYRLQMNS